MAIVAYTVGMGDGFGLREECAVFSTLEDLHALVRGESLDNHVALQHPGRNWQWIEFILRVSSGIGGFGGCGNKLFSILAYRARYPIRCR